MYAPIPMVPGPVTVARPVLDALASDYPSGQIDEDFISLHRSVERSLKHLLGTQHPVIIMTGEGMLALWAALKSTLVPGDSVLVVSTGFFADGIADMARSIGATVDCLQLGYDQTIQEEDRATIEQHIKSCHPKMLCAVHCETPSGTLNPLGLLGELKQQYEIPLFYADVVSSLGGCPVNVDEWHIDLALCGSQKCLALPPSLSMVAVSPTAWKYIHEVNYQGYDALLPFESVYKAKRWPYTPNWHALAALQASLQSIYAEGIHAVFRRHHHTASFVHRGLKRLGIALWPRPEAILSPTVTAARTPEGFDCATWRSELRHHGLVVAGSFGIMADTVFRLGHMGTQAYPALAAQALDVMEEVLSAKRGVWV